MKWLVFPSPREAVGSDCRVARANREPGGGGAENGPHLSALGSDKFNWISVDSIWLSTRSELE